MIDAKLPGRAEVLVTGYFRGRKLSDEFTIRVNVTPTLFVDQVRFDLWLLKAKEDSVSAAPVFSGVFNAGLQGQFAEGCINGDYYPLVPFTSGSLSLTEDGLDVPFFRILGELVPAGGSLTVSCSLLSSDFKIHKQSRQALERGYPPAVTPLGYLMFFAGCGLDLRCLRHVEGGQDSSWRLQGFKPLDQEQGRRKGIMLIRELHQFIATEAENDELARGCRFKAFALIEKLRT